MPMRTLGCLGLTTTWSARWCTRGLRTTVTSRTASRAAPAEAAPAAAAATTAEAAAAAAAAAAARTVTNESGDFPPALLVLRSPTTDPWWNIAFEDWLFRNVDVSGQLVLFLWRNSPSVIIGRNQNPWNECNLPLMERDGVAMVRRRSGGGSVYHDLGNLNCTLLFPRRDFRRDRFTNFLAQSLNTTWPGLRLSVNERNDIVQGGFKVSGSAYKLGGRLAYHHLTLLFRADTSRLGTYLRSHRAPAIKTGGVASVRSPVSNIIRPAGAQAAAPSIRVKDGSNGDPGSLLDFDLLCDAIVDGFRRAPNGTGSSGLDNDAIVAMRQLSPKDIEERPVWGDGGILGATGEREVQANVDELQSWEWMYGQTPRFTLELVRSFDWGHARVAVQCHKGLVSETSVELNDDLMAIDQLPDNVRDLASSVLEPTLGERFTPAHLAERFRPEAVLSLLPASDADALGVDTTEKLAELYQWLQAEL